MKNSMFKRSIAFLMSTLLVFTTFASDFTKVTATAATSDVTSDNLTSSTTLAGSETTVTKTATINGNKITFNFLVNGSTKTDTTTSTEYAKTDIVFVMDLSNSMKENSGDGVKSCGGHEELVCGMKEGEGASGCDGGHSHSDSCYATVYHKADELSKCNNITTTPQSRLDLAKQAVKDFANSLLGEELRQYVNIGIASFASYGHEDLALSNDKNAVSRAVSNLVVAHNENGTNRIGAGGTNIQAGLIAAQNLLKDSTATNKYIIILSDGVPTYAYKGIKKDSNSTKLNTNEFLQLYSAFTSEIIGNGKDTASNVETVYTSTVSQAYIAKKDYKVFSIAYDLSVADSKTMKNVASANTTGEKGVTYFHNAASDGVGTSISEVMKTIAKSVVDTLEQPAANNITITDTLPSYITFDKQTVETAAADEFTLTDGEFTWKIDEAPKAGESCSISVEATIDFDKMLKYYIDNGNEAEIRAQLESEEGLTVELNGNVNIGYIIPGDSTPKTNTDIAIDGSAGVPETTVKQYPVRVVVKVDGNVDDSLEQTIYGFKGDVVNANMTPINTKYPVADYNYDKTTYAATVTEAGATIEVVLTKKAYNVSFKSLTTNGLVDVVDDPQTVIRGTAATDPFEANEALKAQFEAYYAAAMVAGNEENAKYDYTFESWTKIEGSSASMENITDNTVYMAQYSSNLKKYDVTFVTPSEDYSKDVTSQEVSHGNNATRPSYDAVVDTTKLPEGVESVSVVWKDGDGNVFDFDNTPITSDITLTAEYTENLEKYTVTYMDWDNETPVETTPDVTYNTSVGEKLHEALANYTYTDSEGKAKIKLFVGWNTEKNQSVANFDGTTVVKGNVTVYPAYSDVSNSYTVIWEYLDSTAKIVSTSVNVAYNGSATCPVTPATIDDYQGKKYTFNGWSMNEGAVAGLDANGNVTGVKSDVTITAQYGKDTVTYTFTFNYVDENGEKKADTVSGIAYGDTLEAPLLGEYTTIDGVTHKQIGWSNSDFECVVKNGSADATEELYYTVKFVDKNGVQIGDTLSVKENSTVSSTPEVSDIVNGSVKYVFNDTWTSNNQTAIDGEITSNTVFTANYDTYVECHSEYSIDSNKYGNNFNVEFVKIVENAKYSSTDETNYPITVGEKKYVLSGVTTKETTPSVDENGNAVNNVLVFELTEAPQYTVNFIGTDGTTSIGSETHYLGEEFTYPTNVAVSNNDASNVYTFNNDWRTEDDNKFVDENNGLITVINEEVTVNLYAKETATARTFTLQFVAEDGTTVLNTVSGLQSVDAVASTKANAAAPTKEPTNTEVYTGSWSEILHGQVSISDWVANAAQSDEVEVTFTTQARFETSTRLYVVRFFVGQEEIGQAQYIAYEQAATAPETVTAPEGMQFVGWDTDYTKIVADTLVNAILKPVFTITYVNYDGEVLATDSYPKYGVDSYEAVVMTAEAAKAFKTLKGVGTYNYKFINWMLSEEVSYNENATLTVDKDITLKAVFSDEVPGKFFVLYPWVQQDKRAEFENYSSSDYTKGIAITDESFDTAKLVAKINEGSKGYYDDLSEVVKSGAPVANDFEQLPVVPNATATVDWYVAKVCTDGIHVDGVVNYVRTEVSASEVYAGENLSDTFKADVLAKLGSNYEISADEWTAMSGNVDFVNAGETQRFEVAATYTADGKSFKVTVPVAVVITRRVVTIVSNTATKEYDGTALVGTLEITGDGFVEGEAEAKAIGTATNVADGTVKNTVVVAFAENSNPENYVFYVTEGTLSVTKRTVTVTASTVEKEYGDEDPYFTGVANVTNDVAGDVQGYAWRNRGEEPGVHTIYAGYNLDENLAENYNVVLINGSLTIGEAPVVEEVPPVTPATTPTVTPTPRPTPVTPTPTPVEPTPEPEPEVEEVPEEVIIPDEEVAQADAPEVELDEEPTPLAPAPVVEIIDEETPLAAGHCWIHWLILVDALIFAAYAALRATANARELKELSNTVEE